jgi:ATP-dependent DNA helicase 2 subunit 1
MTMELGPGCQISVNGYILLKRQEPARSCYVWLGGEKPQLVQGVTTQLADGDSAAGVGDGDQATQPVPVSKDQIRKAYKFGGEQVVFTPDEVTALRNFGEPVLRIIGFKPAALLPVWASLTRATFIYPTEEVYAGSTRVFAALHQKLLRAEKMGVAWFIARKNAAPVLVAVVPSAEHLGDVGEQTTPPGLWLIQLPFADDIRQNPEVTQVKSPDSLIDAMRQIVSLLHLPKGQYVPEKYPNPGNVYTIPLK